MDGWVKIHRRLTDWEWFDDDITFKLFIYLLLKANHKPKKWNGITIKRGQLVTGRKKLSAELGKSEQTIRTHLKRLKSTNEITIKTTNKYSIITICKYESYQAKEKNNNQQDNQQANQQLTNNQPTTNQQLTTNKNDKKEKKEKNGLVVVVEVENGKIEMSENDLLKIKNNFSENFEIISFLKRVKISPKLDIQNVPNYLTAAIQRLIQEDQETKVKISINDNANYSNRKPSGHSRNSNGVSEELKATIEELGRQSEQRGNRQTDDFGVEW